jgi:hypothetical protein
MNDLPEGTTLGQMLEHRSVTVFDSTAIMQLAYVFSMQTGVESKRYIAEDSPYVARVRNILVSTWSSALSEDSATVSHQQKRGVTADSVIKSCGAYTGDYAFVFDSLMILPAFPPGALSPEAPQNNDSARSPIMPPPPAVPPPPPPPFSNPPPEPPQRTQYGPVYLFCYFSVIRLGDCRKILTLQTGTDVFELSDLRSCTRKIRQAAKKALETTHTSPVISPTGAWN